MRSFTCLAALLFAVSLPLHAAPGAVEVKSVAEMDVVVVNAKGVKETKRQPVEKAVPGDVVIYTTTYKNLIAKPVGNIAITNPVPSETTYQGGSASGANTDIAFSVDGGKTWGTPDTLRITGKDGKERAALPAEYTHIRWTYRGELPAGKSGSVSFRAMIK